MSFVPTTQLKFTNKIRLILLMVVSVAFGLFLTGLFAPLLTLKKFWVLKNQVSIVQGIAQMFDERQYLLVLLMFAFTVIFPLYKFQLLYRFCLARVNDLDAQRRTLERLSHISKWSMLDVFVVALLVVSVKLGSVAKVNVHYGLYLFASSVIISMLLTWFLIRVTRPIVARATTSRTSK